jgi:cytochrome c oxidase subunit 2
MLKRAKALFLGLMTSVISLPLSGALGAEEATWNLNMPRGVTEVSQAAYDIHMIMMWICTVIGVLVFGFMFYVMYAHRKSRGVKAANFHENLTVEILWTIVPALILIVMAVPATTALLKVYDTENPDIDIKVTGYQWKWQYEYIGEDIKFMSELRTSQDEQYGREPKGEHYLREVTQPLVIPTNKKVRFLITGNDVIHSWWVPDFAVKRDAIPGLFHSGLGQKQISRVPMSVLAPSCVGRIIHGCRLLWRSKRRPIMKLGWRAKKKRQCSISQRLVSNGQTKN